MAGKGVKAIAGYGSKSISKSNSGNPKETELDDLSSYRSMSEDGLRQKGQQQQRHFSEKQPVHSTLFDTGTQVQQKQQQQIPNSDVDYTF